MTHRPTHLLLLVPCLPRTPSLAVGRLSERVSSVLSGAWRLAPYSVDAARTNDPLMMLRGGRSVRDGVIQLRAGVCPICDWPRGHWALTDPERESQFCKGRRRG